jgi:hypothetical protein
MSRKVGPVLSDPLELNSLRFFPDNLYTLDGLESNSEYDVQAATVNAAGLSEYVALPRFKTSTGSSVHLTWPLLYSVAGIILFQMRDHASW